MKKIISALGILFLVASAYSQPTLESSSYPGLRITNNDSQIRLYGDGIEKWGLGSTGAPGSDFIIYDVENSAVRLLIDEATGNVGIGTTTPAYKLDVNGIIKGDRVVVSDGNATSSIFNYGLNQNLYIGAGKDNAGNKNEIILYNYACEDGCNVPRIRLLGDTVYTPGNVGVGTTAPDAKLHIFGTNAGNGNVMASIMIGLNNGTEIQAIQGGTDPDIQSLAFRVKSSSTNADPNFEALRIRYDGNIGIGTTAPDAKLAVNGDIHAREVRVDLNGAVAPDFVFEPDYTLRSLEATEAYIKANKHLPEIPSAAEMEEKGIQLKEMNLKLLQKVEELTLYIIEQNKKIETMQKEINQLKKR